MDNQHRHINGYRELTQKEIDAINKLKALAEQCGEALHDAARIDGHDPRAMAIARTEMQTAFMWAIRAIARPTTFG